MSLARFIVTPETRLAVHAVQRLAAAVMAGRRATSPLVLHGPPGVGKTLLVTGLLEAVSQVTPPRIVRLLAAADLATDGPPDASRPVPAALEGARACDLVIVEDVQHLPMRAAAALVSLIDHLHPRRRPVVVTASDGPGDASMTKGIQIPLPINGTRWPDAPDRSPCAGAPVPAPRTSAPWAQ